MSLVPLILMVLAAPPQAAPAGHAPKGTEHPPAEHQAAKPPAAGAVLPSKPSLETKGLAGSVVFECDFGTTADRNYDGWPDGWTRRHGAGFHDFLKIGIAEDKADAARGSALFLEMNGGSAEVGSPKITITPSFSYKLEGECRLTDLVHDDARITLTFLNNKGQPLQTESVTLSSQASSREWQSFRLNVTPHQQTKAASFALQVAPRGQRQDLRGQAAFRRFTLQRLPRMTVRTGSRLNIFTDKDQVELECEIAGIPHAQSTLHFELQDHEGRSLDTHSEPLTTEKDGVARATWKPPLPGFGFYQVQVRWQGQAKETLKCPATLAVLRPAPLPKSGQFGWTLPAGEEPLDSAQMAALLTYAGVHWAKYPVTFTAADSSAADRIAWFAEKLSLQGIEMVGVLDHPPSQSTAPIASIFEDADAWKPWVDPIMTRLSLKVRWWQLGSDQDTSLVGYPRLAEKTQEVKTHLERFGQQVKLGAGWQWTSPPPPGNVPFAMHSLTSEPPLTAEELELHLARAATPGPAAPLRWVMLDALPDGEYSLTTRAHDLAARMLAAKLAGADAVFLTRPFDPKTGLMQADGTPGALFLPWRTTAAAIAGAEYVGQMQLLGGSTNYVFVRDGRAVMAVWNDTPTEETMYFGEDLRQMDLWGRETIPPAKKSETGNVQHRLSVTALPTFVAGLNEGIARFKLAAQFESPHVESTFNREQTIYLRLKNFFPQAISGEVALVAPVGWKRDSQGTRFRLGPGEETRLPISVRLTAEASTGPQPLRLDFNLAADRNYQFNVQRTLQLGLADVSISMTSRLREDGLLEVTQQVTNLTGQPLSFQCVLFCPGRRRESRQLLASPSGQTPLLFLLDDGESLLGQKLILRAEELGGGRVLNYSLTAER